MQDLTIIVVTHNSARTLERCLSSLAEHAAGVAVVVVDNASSDETLSILARHPEVKVMAQSENLGFGRANNLAMAQNPARFYYMHNADAYLAAPTLAEALAMMRARPALGIAGLPLIFPDGRPQIAAYAFSSPAKWALQAIGIGALARRLGARGRGSALWRVLGRLNLTRAFVAQMEGLDPGKVAAVDWVCGASMLLREEARVDLRGGFDPAFFLYAEDEDLCRRAKANGWQVAQLGVTPTIHELGWGKASRRVIDLKAQSIALLIDKHFARGSFARLAMKALLRLKIAAWRLG